MLKIKKKSLIYNFQYDLYDKEIKETYTLCNLNRSFGHGIGNMIRRNILANSPGIAVYGYRIDKFFHEFDHNQNIKEDSNLILLRFKDVLIKFNENFKEPIQLTFELEGPNTIYANILNSKDNNILVINGNMELFTIVTFSKIKLDIFINKGTGFISCIENSKLFDDHSQIIGTTSIYSRINTVTYHITNKDTTPNEYDSIEITVEHDYIYKKGFIFKNCLAAVNNTLVDIAKAVDIYDADFSKIKTDKVEIIKTLRYKTNLDTLTAIKNLDFNTIDELYELLNNKPMPEIKEKDLESLKIILDEIFDYEA